MKEFNLEQAKQGNPVCTRDGRKARIICFDRNNTEDNRTIVALVANEQEREYVHEYLNDGRFDEKGTLGIDLMMVTEKKEGWVNVFNLNGNGR